MNPRVPIKPPMKLLRDYSIVFRSTGTAKQLALALNEVAKYAALKLTSKP